MSCDFHQLPHLGIQKLHPYVPGKSIEELAKEQGITDIIKLASNENALGCSPLVREALANLSGHTIATYPATSFHPIKPTLSEHLGIDPSELTLSNGSDLLYTLLLIIFCLHNDKHMMTHEKAFSTYEIQAETLGIPIKFTPILSNWQVDIDSMIKECNEKTGIIFLANPNNPTGGLIPLSQIKHLLESIPITTILVVGEAYFEYAFDLSEKGSLAFLKMHPNLVVTRTFSKAYGLAGLRLGYAISHPDISILLHKVMLPFTVNHAAMQAGLAALKDPAFLEQTLTLTYEGLTQLKEGLSQLPVTILPAHGNFVTIDCLRPALPIYQKLLTQGIIVRPLHAYNMPNHLRVAAGKKHQNERFLEAFNTILRNES